MTLFVEALSGILDTYLLYLFASGFYSQYRNRNSNRLYLLFAFYLIVISCIPISGVFRMMLVWIAIVLFLLCTYVSSVRKSLLTATAFITVSVLVDILCEYPFFFLGISRETILTQGLARCIFIIFAKLMHSLLIVILITCFGRKGLLDIPFRDLFPLATCQLVSAFICIVSLELIDKVSHFFLMLLTLSVVGILYINIVFFVYMRLIRMNYENEQRKQLAEQQLQSQISYYQQLKETIEDTRSMWHDIKKQITAVTALVQNHDTVQAANCLDEIAHSFHEVNRIVDYDHPVINAILSDALQKSRLLGIDLEMDVFVSPALSLSPLDLSVILGNTLDNAIRACDGISAGSSPKVIELKLRQKDSLLFYHISNPYDPAFSAQKQKGIHGYGLKNVAERVERNHGTIHIDQTSDQYSVEIILNLP